MILLSFLEMVPWFGEILHSLHVGWWWRWMWSGNSFSVIEGNTSAITSADGWGGTIFCRFGRGMVDDDVCFTAIGGKDFCDATSMSQTGELSFILYVIKQRCYFWIPWSSFFVRSMNSCIKWSLRCDHFVVIEGRNVGRLRL